MSDPAVTLRSSLSPHGTKLWGPVSGVASRTPTLARFVGTHFDRNTEGHFKQYSMSMIWDLVKTRARRYNFCCNVPGV